MALIKCSECGKEFSDRAAACPNCGCPVEYSLHETENIENVTGEAVKDSALDTLAAFATSVAASAADSISHAAACKKVGPITIDQQNQRFQIHGKVLKNGKKSGIIGKSMKGLMAVSTMGLSVAAESALGMGKTKVGNREWYDFSDLISYGLIEDDSVITSGGSGRAYIGNFSIGSHSRVSKKRVDSLTIKVTLNSFSNPCILIPITTKPLKPNSKEYSNAISEAQKILAALDVIAHNK
ncbi:MAG: Zn-ribbon domain-containing protein [Lachnospiraceae bacterium]|nr:Zn-ribbon domain-containing protein [Lachnospiraceae bacterium]